MVPNLLEKEKRRYTMNCHIIDTTLREGEQTPGVLFSLEEKQHIVDRLVRVGIQEVELGISSQMSQCIPHLIEYCRENHPGLSLALWCRCKREDILYAGNVLPDILALSIPVSDIHIENRLAKDREWVLKKMEVSIALARKLGLKVAVGFEDATRADQNFLAELARSAEKAGASRIRLADTVGIASPASISQLVLQMRKAVDQLPIGVHTHNDFGMATGNAVAALEAGAGSADAVVLGLGERTGCAILEELVGYLGLIKSVSGFQIDEIKPLAQYVAAVTARKIPDNKPIIGDAIFSCESGLHVQGLLCDPRTYEPYAPEKVGSTRTLQIGAKSGRRALAQRLTELGVEQSSLLAEQTIHSVRALASQLQRPLTNAELLELTTLFK